MIASSTINSNSRYFQTDFSQTNIEGSNCKKIPSEENITRLSANNSSSGSPTDTSKNIPSSTETSSNDLKSAPSAKEIVKSYRKKSPIAVLKRMLSNGSTNGFGNHKNISGSSSPTEPSSPVKTSSTQLASWERISKTDSIDKTIIENNDLKKIFVRSYNIDVKNIEDFLDEGSIQLNGVNSIPKPPRISADMEKESGEGMKSMLL